MVPEYEWETNMLTPPPAREAFRQAVAQVAAKAHAKLPQCTGRIDSAVKLVLAGDVKLMPGGGARVASRSDAQVTYHTVNGHCDCKDFPRAPEGLCAHRLAYGIMRRASELVPQTPPVEREPSAAPVRLPAAPAAALPEAPASANCHITIAGRQVQLTLRDTDEDRLLQRLQAVLARYPLPQPVAPPQSPLTPQQHNAAAMHRPVTGFCPVHNVHMHLNHGKDGRSWYSHRLPEGGFCKGR